MASGSGSLVLADPLDEMRSADPSAILDREATLGRATGMTALGRLWLKSHGWFSGDWLLTAPGARTPNWQTLSASSRQGSRPHHPTARSARSGQKECCSGRQ